MTHLSPDELVDALDHALAPGPREHLAACADCRREVAEAAALLHEATAVSAFEPSPLFWDHLSDRVRAAVAAESPAPVRRWFDWPVMLPLGALGLLVLALVTSIPLSVTPAAQRSTGIQSGTLELADAVENDERWAVMFDLVGEVDLDAVVESGLLGRPGSAERALVHLTPNEQEELVRLLREELRSGG